MVTKKRINPARVPITETQRENANLALLKVAGTTLTLSENLPLSVAKRVLLSYFDAEQVDYILESTRLEVRQDNLAIVEAEPIVAVVSKEPKKKNPPKERKSASTDKIRSRSAQNRQLAAIMKSIGVNPSGDAWITARDAVARGLSMDEAANIAKARAV